MVVVSTGESSALIRPGFPTVFPIMQKPPRALVDHVGYNFNAEEAKNNRLVFKLGRSTGPTTGIQHYPRVTIREYDGSHITVKSTEHVIVPAITNMPFAVPGDSGALVYDPHADPAGMIWGCPVNCIGGVDISCTFYTPFDSIMFSLTQVLSDMFGPENFLLKYAP